MGVMGGAAFSSYRFGLVPPLPPSAPQTLCCCVIAAITINCSYVATARARAARAARHETLIRASRSQALLETAMPPTIARALLVGTPAFDLTRSFAGASIAFIALDDTRGEGGSGGGVEAAAAGGDPAALLAWLNAVFVAFDGLVDAYGERVNKIEVVR